jgi:very-short-patch-repair endonuclease
MNSKLPLYAPADLWKRLKPFAREMRHTPTPAEELLWERLRNRRLNQLKFRRQFAIERFIVDFVCLEHRLIIEVDGSIHDQQQEYDELRQLFLESIGFRVLRFSNDAVLHATEAVVEVIGEWIASQR